MGPWVGRSGSTNRHRDAGHRRSGTAGQESEILEKLDVIGSTGSRDSGGPCGLWGREELGPFD